MDAKKVKKEELPQGDRPYYELFPEDDYAGNEDWTPLDPAKVNVRVYRIDGQAQQTFLGRHTSAELPDEGAVTGLYGGGRFLLVAVWNSGRNNGQVARRRTITLPGEQRGAQSVTATLSAAAANPVAPGKSPIEHWMAFATIVIPALMGYLQHTATLAQADRATEAAKAQEQHRVLLEQQKAAFESLTAAMKDVRPAAAVPAEPGNVVGTIKEVAALMKELAPKQESDAFDKMLEGFLPILGMKMMGFGGMPGMPPGALGGVPSLVN